MEVTLLLEASENAFRIIEKAREHAVGLMDTAVEFTAERKQYLSQKRMESLFTGARRRKTKIQNVIGTAIILLGFWLILSGKYDLFHMTIGVLCSTLVAVFCHDLLFANTRVGDMRIVTWRFVTYIPWLIWQIALSNIHVASIVLKRRMPIDPQIVQFKSKLETDISFVALANSITLTPGTITMDIKDGVYYVHALNKKFAQELNAGDMEDKVAHIFMEADHLYVQDVLDAARIYAAIRV